MTVISLKSILLLLCYSQLKINVSVKNLRESPLGGVYTRAFSTLKQQKSETKQTNKKQINTSMRVFWWEADCRCLNA